MDSYMLDRRNVLRMGAAAMGGPLLGGMPLLGLEAGKRPGQDGRVRVLNPLNRVPLSFIIDDSTCLVNMAHFAIPQFAEVFPNNYKQDWRSLPREIPDSFVRKFGQWCREHGVKGKYSIVPYPAMVGWVDRELPGWSKQQLRESLKLVREFMSVDWDIHPEMVTHTWAINTRTGRPYEERSERFMENWGFSVGKSADELADYMSYALRILQNAGLQCEGITTPGGFGSRVLKELSIATLQSCRQVYKAEVPHYFRHLFTDQTSVAPRVENASGLDGDDPQCVVSIIGCTGDWFGGWDGLTPGSVDKFITADLQSGRMVEVIERGEPAIMVCHWPGIYFNGQETGFNIFKEAVLRMHRRYDNLVWMKLSEIARYWAAKELTTIEVKGQKVVLTAPFGTPNFTMSLGGPVKGNPRVIAGGNQKTLRKVADPLQLANDTWSTDCDNVIVCMELTRGKSELII